MKTEEIFNKFCTVINRDFGDYVIRDKKGFINAMQEFAEQYHKEELRGEFIQFLSESIIELPEGKGCIDIVDKYLKQRK